MDRVRTAAEFIRKYDDLASRSGADPASIYRAAINAAVSSLVQAEAISAQGYFSGKLRKLLGEINVEV